MDVYLNQILNQETQGMAAAKFSRSHKSFKENLKDVSDTQSSDFNKKWAVGYGHASILDCANICAAIERVSMIAAKFIEDFPLYNGQESSTRYIPFDIGSFEDNIVSPYENKDDYRRTLQIGLMEFYRHALPIQISYIAKINNIDLDRADNITKNAIKAKAFDVLRGYLPAGAKTQLALITTLRQAVDRIEMMLRHPCNEIKEIGRKLQDEIIKIYPGAADGLIKESHIKVADDYYNEEYWENYYCVKSPFDEYLMVTKPEDLCINESCYSKLAKNRHLSKKLPPIFDITNGTFNIEFHIDYGSWRDIHRHRNCQQTSSLLDGDYFETFYFENLAPELKNYASYLINQAGAIKCLFPHDQFMNQYSIPMGFKVLYNAKWSLTQFMYVMELRSKPTVHHTLRIIMKKIYDKIPELHSFINVDFSGMDNPLEISMKRGTQA